MTLFFSSDLHLNHAKILTFKDDDGNLFRGQFADADEMNEHIIECHNKVVRPYDKWYCLGDVGFGIKKLSPLLHRMNGHKRLILGNHDYAERKDFEFYFQHFEKVMESRRMGPILLTHRPVYLGEHEIRIKANVHGHIHERVLPDKRYLNISVERIAYTPVSFDEIETMIEAQGVSLEVETV